MTLWWERTPEEAEAFSREVSERSRAIYAQARDRYQRIVTLLGDTPPQLKLNDLKKAVWDDLLDAFDRGLLSGVAKGLGIERAAKKPLLPIELLPYFVTAYLHSGKTHPSRINGDDRTALSEIRALLERPATTEGLFRALANKVLETHAAPNKTVGEAPSTTSPNHKRSVWTKSLGCLLYTSPSPRD